MSRNAHLTLAQFFQQAEKSILNVRKLLNLYSLASKMLEISRLRGFSLLFFADSNYERDIAIGTASGGMGQRYSFPSSLF